MGLSLRGELTLEPSDEGGGRDPLLQEVGVAPGAEHLSVEFASSTTWVARLIYSSICSVGCPTSVARVKAKSPLVI